MPWLGTDGSTQSRQNKKQEWNENSSTGVQLKGKKKESKGIFCCIYKQSLFLTFWEIVTCLTKIFHIVCFPFKVKDLVSWFPLYLQCVEQCLSQRKCSKIIYQIEQIVNRWWWNHNNSNHSIWRPSNGWPTCRNWDFQVFPNPVSILRGYT